ncbi:winged helix DNA-binding domain-containing protein [Devosia sp. SL43]|uniref:winged helix DNA-binding domain-containing protein n=1 Tax=Devosia sp. SL43 TaxID=2806348 RepID=UPI001F2C77F9|nr:winged helix DNA-binding domain-containing protein [Devosia sp. SL43]UJW84026.1 AlkZ family DNA glycosylase [Devosia sp. SL43]
MPQMLTNRQLNRATLARQWMLERADIAIPDAIAFLLGLQAQTSGGPYQALWNRLRGFRHEDLTTLIVDKSLLRATSMRTTLHLHTAADMRAIRPVMQPVLDRTWQTTFGKKIGGADRAEVHRHGVELLDQSPLTSGELGKRLAETWPAAEPLALAQVLHCSETLIQIPPTRIWGHGGPPLLSRIETWAGTPVGPAIELPNLVLRYLAAYGPASVMDMQTWSGLTKLAPAFEAIADQLVTFEGEDGRVLYDLPDGPRPDPDTPAPVRFMPEYDNVWLGFADRYRIQPELARDRMVLVNGYVAAYTVDGLIAGNWTLKRNKGDIAITILPFRTLTKSETADVEAEAHAHGAFLADGKGTVSVAWEAVA